MGPVKLHDIVLQSFRDFRRSGDFDYWLCLIIILILLMLLDISTMETYHEVWCITGVCGGKAVIMITFKMVYEELSTALFYSEINAHGIQKPIKIISFLRHP